MTATQPGSGIERRVPVSTRKENPMGRSVPSSSKPALEGGTPTRTEFLVFGKPTIGEEEIQEVAAALRSGWIGSGPRVQTFEREFLSYIGGAMPSRYPPARPRCICPSLPPGSSPGTRSSSPR